MIEIILLFVGSFIPASLYCLDFSSIFPCIFPSSFFGFVYPRIQCSLLFNDIIVDCRFGVVVIDQHYLLRKPLNTICASAAAYGPVMCVPVFCRCTNYTFVKPSFSALVFLRPRESIDIDSRDEIIQCDFHWNRQSESSELRRCRS